MFVLHFDGQIQTFPTLRRAVNFLEDRKRVAPKPVAFIVDTKATANYTAPHPSSKKKPAVFVRANPLLHPNIFVTLSQETLEVRPIDCAVVTSRESWLRIANSNS